MIQYYDILGGAMGLILCGVSVWLYGVHMEMIIPLDTTSKYYGMMFITLVNIMITFHE